MNKNPFVEAIFILLLSLTAVAVSAQTDAPPPTEAQNFQPAERPRLLESLNLSDEQVREIRLINRTRRPVMQQAQINWREAQRELDAAIYADEASEEEIQRRVKRAQNAQADLIKERATTEYLIRRVLTAEQLEKFRILRERFRQGVGRGGQQPRRPFKRLRQQRDQNRPPQNF